ncbi:MAG: hypothetical protein GWP06_15275 [Actinobacteria bacterium]|nr:hypothetical protein [Actinomycetota bacterium]
MSCYKIQKNISAYFDGALTEKEKAQVLHHAKECKSCAGFFQYFEVLQKDIEKSTVNHEPPAYVGEMLFRRIAAEKQQAIRTQGIRKLLARLRDFRIQYQPAFRIVEFATVFLLALFAGIQIHQVWTGRNISDSTNLAAFEEPPSSVDDFFQKGMKDYLEKSSLILRQLKNEDTSRLTNASFSQEKELARDLLNQSKLISSKLKQDSSSYIGSLIDELEPIFMDVANFDQQKDRRSLDVIRQTINDKNYLMRLESVKATNSRLQIRY